VISSTGDAVSLADPMLATVRDTPGQWARAVEIARAVRLPALAPRAVVVAGMGGSGVAGDVAALVADAQAEVPTVAVHGESLPAFVGNEDLVVLVSHSGGTQETLSCAEQAIERGARLVAVTSGGALGRLVADHGGTVVEVPAEAPPRASMALLSVPVLAALEAVGVIDRALDSCATVPALLRDLDERFSDADAADAPLRMAAELGARIPVFLGVCRVGAVVATRARNQVAENAERPAVAAELPEADHNQLVGWAGAGTGGSCDLVVVRSPDETPGTRRRVEATIDLAGPGFARVHQHRLPAGDVIQRLAAGFYFVDLLSVHLALLAGVDPTPIRAIDELKRRL
jgi:glucose/mannose-6-phosphate isomerase